MYCWGGAGAESDRSIFHEPNPSGNINAVSEYFVYTLCTFIRLLVDALKVLKFRKLRVVLYELILENVLCFYRVSSEN